MWKILESAISGRRGASFWERLMTGAHFGRRGNFNLKHSHRLIFTESQTCFISPIIQAVSFIFMWRQKGNGRTATQHEALQPNTCILKFSFCPSFFPNKNIFKQEELMICHDGSDKTPLKQNKKQSAINNDERILLFTWYSPLHQKCHKHK